MYRKYRLMSSLQSAGDGTRWCRVGGGDQLLVESMGDIRDAPFDLGLRASCELFLASEHCKLCSVQYQHGPTVSSGMSHLRLRVLSFLVSTESPGGGGARCIPAIHARSWRSHVALSMEAFSARVCLGLIPAEQ